MKRKRFSVEQIAAFLALQPRQRSNSTRNGIFALGNVNWDISLTKKFNLPERLKPRIQNDLLDVFKHFIHGRVALSSLRQRT